MNSADETEEDFVMAAELSVSQDVNVWIDQFLNTCLAESPAHNQCSQQMFVLDIVISYLFANISYQQLTEIVPIHRHSHHGK